MTDDERPVREQLKKASIDANAARPELDSVDAIGQGTSGSNRQPSVREDDRTVTEDAPRPISRPQTRSSSAQVSKEPPVTSSDNETSAQYTTGRKSHGRKRSRDSAIQDFVATINSTSTSTHESTTNHIHTRSHDKTDAARPMSKGSATSAAVEAGVDETADNAKPDGKPSASTAHASIPAPVPAPAPSSPRTKRKRVGERDSPASNSEDDRSAASSRKASAEVSVAANDPVPAATATTATATAPRSTSPPANNATFASSGFGALAASSNSGFGALSSAKPLNSFASSSTGATSADSNDKKTTSSNTSIFGGGSGSSSSNGAKPLSSFASAATGFASGGTSGFGSVGGGIGSGIGIGIGAGGFGSLGGSRLTSFASTTAADSSSAKKAPVTAFGAPVNDDDDDGENDSGEQDDASDENHRIAGRADEKQDERFYAQHVETGEENEETVYTCRAKLYNFVMSDEAGKKEWKERGVGTLRLNVSPATSGDERTKTKARLVMRADGSHRVVLNTPVKKEIKFGNVKGDAPQGGIVYFMGSMDGGKLELLQLKMRQQIAEEMYDRVVDIQQLM